MQRRVPQEFVDTWDAWLQEGLHASRKQLGAQWLEVYLTSPVWRFALAEGICGEECYAGVMLPSVDRVGRYFPLAVVAPLEVGSCLLEAACGAGRAWFDSAEDLARQGLDASDLDLDAFDGEVEALAALAAPEELAQSTRLMEHIARAGFAKNASAWCLPLLGESPQRVANAMLSIELQRAFRPCALWWTQGSEALEPSWLVTRGLPAPEQFAAMLSGQWRAAGWTSLESATHNVQLGAMPSQAAELEEPRPLEMQIGAVHPPLQRGPASSAEPRFVLRPEIGLWGVIAVDGADSDARASLLSDVVHDLAPQATLTAQVERARRALQAALGSRTGGAWGPDTEVSVTLLLVHGRECALLSSGAAQAVRVRQGVALEIGGGEPVSPAEAVAGDVPDAAELGGAPDVAGDNELMALLAAPATPEPVVNVCYEHVDGDDLWLLGAAGTIPQVLVGELSESWLREVSRSAHAPSLEETLQALLAQHLRGAAVAQTVPLMVLATRIAESTVT